MTNEEILKFINKSMDNINSCTIPKENWCPTCSSEMETITTFASYFIENHDEEKAQIVKANKENL